MLPEKLCHTEKMAPGTVAIGNMAKWVAASEVASPEFCIPTSMAIAVRLGKSMPSTFPTPYPRAKPSTLCRITTTATTRLHEMMLCALWLTMIPMIKAMAKVETIGSMGVIFAVNFAK